MTFAIRRIIRTKRRMVRAAEILEREATCLRDSHTICGEWDHPDAGHMSDADRAARADHDEMMMVAKYLRSAAGGA